MNQDKASRTEISKKRVLANSASSALLLLFNLVVLLWVQQHLIRRISEEEYALLPVVTSFLSFAPLLTQILVGGLGRYMTVAYAKGDDEQIRRISSTMFPLLSGAALLLFGLGVWGVENIETILKVTPENKSQAQLMFFIMIGAIALELPLSCFSSGLMMTQRLALHDLISALTQIFRMGLLLFLLLGVSTSVVWVVVASTSSQVLSSLTVAWLSMRYVPAQRPSRRSIHLPIVRELVGYGSWSLLGQSAATVNSAMDPLILNRFSTPLHVSTFYAGGIAPRQLTMLLAPISRPFIPVLATLHATGDKARLGSIYLRVARYHLVVLLSAAIPALCFADQLMFLYLGGRYPQASTVMSILVFVPVLGAFNALGVGTLMAVGKMRALSIRQIVVQAVNFGFTVLLVSVFEWGAIGCASASIIAIILVEAPLLWTYCRKEAGVTVRQWLVKVVRPTILPALAVLLVGLGLRAITPTASWTTVLGYGALIAVLYIMAFLRFGLQVEDANDLQRVLARLPGSVGGVIRFWIRPRLDVR